MAFKLSFWQLCLTSCIPQLTYAFPALNQTQGHGCQQTKVVVLGGGMAGITAAQALSNASITDFLIVEYRGDLGGRMTHTTFGADAYGKPYTVELGANWVQGLELDDGQENPIWRLTQKYNLTTTTSQFDSVLTYNETGYTNYSNFIADFAAVQDLYNKADDDDMWSDIKGISVRAALSLLNWKPQKDPKRQAAEWMTFDFEFASTPEESSAEYAIVGASTNEDGSQDPGGVLRFVHDTRGFNTIVKGEASTFLNCSANFNCKSDARLHLNTHVSRISHSDSEVTVYNSDGSCIRAEYAICTFSLGVLQNDAVTFEPPLPESKNVSIATLSMATYTKIFLQFPPDKVFWDTSVEFFLYADPYERGYYPLFQSLDNAGFLPGSGILFVTVVHDQSYRVEAQDDETTKQQILAVLRDMYGADKVPMPTAFMYPRWSLQPWAFGSYSNWPAGATLDHQDNLRANLGRLYFAGEATSADYWGLLHGAYFEGRDAGINIAKQLKGTK